jgi:hypothetical protein
MSPVWKRRLLWILAIVVVLSIVLGFTAWYKLFRLVDQPKFANLEERFKYGSMDAEAEAGLPFWIWVVLPRVFPDYLPGPGGYRAFGLPWEEGHETPVGFAKRTMGFPRITNTCAACHTTTWRTRPDEPPHFIPGGPGHTTGIQAMLRFLTRCANDVRFNPDTLLAEIEQHAPLSTLDRLLYRYGIIPRTKQALQDRGSQFSWMNRPNWPDWGKGRDDPMNLTKYFMTGLPWDQTVGSADFPSAWNLRMREGMNLNWGGETPSPRSVIIDSALGLQADPKHVVMHATWIQEFLNDKHPDPYPFPIDSALAAQGKTVFDANCASCHAAGPGSRMGKVIDISEIKTDANRLITWTQQAADIANQKVASLGVQRTNMIKTNGYQAVPLDGIWLRGPYLHNGSVPNLRDLLEPEDIRTKMFYRGYDVVDPVNVGFDTQSAEAQRLGYKLDTSVKGNGNQGHLYGTTLASSDKQSLMEYLKTL